MTSLQGSDLVAGIFILIVVGIVYFIPTEIAFRTKKKNAKAICLLNVFAGWTFLGWVAALVWAVTND